jgi:Fe-S cluster assembly protein SufD
MTQVADDKNVHVSHFERLELELRRAGSHAWLDKLRRGGIARFDEVGFPNTKQEEWRFTNVAPIARTNFVLPERVQLAGKPPLSFGDEAAAELVFVNGYFARGVEARRPARRRSRASLGEALRTDATSSSAPRQVRRRRHNPFVALNTGFVREGAFVHFARGAVLDRPIHLLFLSVPAPSRRLPPARARRRGGQSRSDDRRDLRRPRRRRLFHQRGDGSRRRQQRPRRSPQAAAGDARRVSRATTQAQVGRTGAFISQSATLGGKLTRNDLNVVLNGDAAEATLNGWSGSPATSTSTTTRCSTTPGPGCPSHELYKHVLKDKAVGVFKGKILVRQPAQKTDSKQTSKSLLLSDDAVMNSQPALEIYADDVKCTHGSTIGPVDEDMVFYLHSRGVSLDAARHLLTYAFAADITRRYPRRAVRRRLEGLDGRTAGAAAGPAPSPTSVVTTRRTG